MFLAVFATHGTAHIAWFDQPMRQIRSNPVANCPIAPLSIPIYDGLRAVLRAGLARVSCCRSTPRSSCIPSDVNAAIGACEIGAILAMVSMRLTRLTIEPITAEVETVGRAC
jgi:hypothetical protein